MPVEYWIILFFTYFLVHFRQKLHVYCDINSEEELVEFEGVTTEDSSDKQYLLTKNVSDFSTAEN